MSRIVDAPIPNPELDAQKRPLTFRWAGQRLRVAQVLDEFRVTGRWWELEPEVVFWRVLTTTDGVYELTHAQNPSGEWRLYRIWD